MSAFHVSSGQPSVQGYELPRHFKLTKSNAIFLGVVGLLGSAFFSAMSIMTLTKAGTPYIWIGAGFGVAAIGTLIYVANMMFTTLDLQDSSINYRGLFGCKRILFSDVSDINWGGSRGTLTLVIKGSKTWILISNQTFSEDDLKWIAEAIYVGAEAASNRMLRRPIPQLSLRDIPQLRQKDLENR